MTTKTELEAVLDRLGLKVVINGRYPKSTIAGRDLLVVLAEALSPGLIVQLQDQDGTDFFYNTTATEVSDAVQQAYQQHIADWDDPDYDPDPDHYDVVRVFLGRIDGYNLVNFDDPKSVRTYVQT